MSNFSGANSYAWHGLCTKAGADVSIWIMPHSMTNHVYMPKLVIQKHRVECDQTSTDVALAVNALITWIAVATALAPAATAVWLTKMATAGSAMTFSAATCVMHTLYFSARIGPTQCNYDMSRCRGKTCRVSLTSLLSGWEANKTLTSSNGIPYTSKS